ncbi:hypothetical protein MPSEU_000642900 [Mayamaea pseudoterrestris]|nr:hypothetical protein MPSEU_000642900 [Mayamaea pseudoterrestris]
MDNNQNRNETGRLRALSVSHEHTPLLLPTHHHHHHDDDPDSKRSQLPTGNMNTRQETTQKSVNLLYAAVYAVVNVIISAPGLYGYAAVIFNHPIFRDHMNALSKLVIFSSMIHQLSFTLFSTMPFAIGTVQDAGLIFLSSMANTIADEMLSDGASEAAILSTTLVLLPLGTALLGVILIALGKFKLANAVSYLPMPVVGGYLAFIGYFCVQAGVALCISHPLVAFSDWTLVFTRHNLLLAVPGLLAGLVLTNAARRATNEAILPLSMVVIPAFFYLVIYMTGVGLDGARQNGWVGEVSPPVPVTDLFQLVDFTLVRWDLVQSIGWTWVGMVFVVSFASCLDVAAISMDKGEALDTNRELATVGIGNLMSGLTFGFTGSYIFSQTIFTYRTGVHTRIIGCMIMVMFLYIVISPINILEIAPLFFLGSTLIFIGYDLLYEWFIQIRDRVLLSEYATIWGTFVAIQVVGVDFGIVVGVLVAIVDNVVTTAQATTVKQTHKRSRAVWTPAEYKILQDHGYNSKSPLILSLEISGPIFFGSSLALFDTMINYLGIDAAAASPSGPAPGTPADFRSPHTSSALLMVPRTPTRALGKAPVSILPRFCVLDFSQVSSMDASAARTCFLQFALLCSKKGIVVCASCLTPRMQWMLRSHDVAFDEDEEETMKAKIHAPPGPRQSRPNFACDRLLLFPTVHEALEFCEDGLLHQMIVKRESTTLLCDGPEILKLSEAIARFLDAPSDEKHTLSHIDGLRYHEELEFKAGEKIFAKGSHPFAWFVVLQGTVASDVGNARAIYKHRQRTVSGAGLVRVEQKSIGKGGPAVVATTWRPCNIFGYTDMFIDRPRTYSAVATQDGTKVARITKSHMNEMALDSELSALVYRALLRASILDLQNCTCDDV